MPGTQALGVYGAEYWEGDGGNTDTATTDPTAGTGTAGVTDPIVTPTPSPAGAAG
jgi:hypothetical protein